MSLFPVFTEDARQDLRQLITRQADETGQRAHSLVTDLDHAFRFVGSYPRLGRARHDLASEGHLRSWLVAPYLILYNAEENPVLILAVLHGSRDIRRILHTRTLHD